MFKIGNLIRWHEEYDMYITKDTGLGVITDIKNFNNVVIYKIHRIKYSDFINLEERQIQKITKKGVQNEII